MMFRSNKKNLFKKSVAPHASALYLKHHHLFVYEYERDECTKLNDRMKGVKAVKAVKVPGYENPYVKLTRTNTDQIESPERNCKVDDK